MLRLCAGEIAGDDEPAADDDDEHRMTDAYADASAERLQGRRDYIGTRAWCFGLGTCGLGRSLPYLLSASSCSAVTNRGSMSTGTSFSRSRTACTGGRTTASFSIICFAAA